MIESEDKVMYWWGKHEWSVLRVGWNGKSVTWFVICNICFPFIGQFNRVTLACNTHSHYYVHGSRYSVWQTVGYPLGLYARNRYCYLRAVWKRHHSWRFNVLKFRLKKSIIIKDVICSIPTTMIVIFFTIYFLLIKRAEFTRFQFDKRMSPHDTRCV